MGWRFDGLTALVSIAAGKPADLVVFTGNRAKNIEDVERAETIFKDGVDYDPAKLMRSAEGPMGFALTEGGGRPAGESASPSGRAKSRAPLNSSIVRRLREL